MNTLTGRTMAPAAAAASSPRRDRFFVWIALTMLVVLALAFCRSFYLRQVFSDKPLPAYLIVHGVVMTLWYLLFLAQASLVNIGRRDLHRQLGIAGVLLALGVVVTGAFVHLSFIGRMQAAGVISNPQDLARGMGFVLSGLASLVPFVILIALAVALRRKAAVHKRLMYWALVWTLGPAFSDSRPLGQWLDPLVAPHLPFFPSDLFWFAALLAYDWKTLRRLHPATWLGFLLLAFYFFFVTDWLVGSALLQGWLQAYLQTQA